MCTSEMQLERPVWRQFISTEALLPELDIGLLNMHAPHDNN